MSVDLSSDPVFAWALAQIAKIDRLYAKTGGQTLSAAVPFHPFPSPQLNPRLDQTSRSYDDGSVLARSPQEIAYREQMREGRFQWPCSEPLETASQQNTPILTGPTIEPETSVEETDGFSLGNFFERAEAEADVLRNERLVLPEKMLRNFQLLRRCPNGHWTVKNGRLSEASLSGRIAASWNRLMIWTGAPIKEENPLDAVKELFDFLVAQIPHALDVKRAEIRSILLDIFSKLPPERFPRNWIARDVETFLISGLPKVFAHVPLKYADRFDRIRLALKMGIRPTKNPVGKHGSIIYWNCQGKEEALFKPAEISKPSWFCKKGLSFRKQACLIRENGNVSSMHSDRAAFLLDRYFQFGFIPYTVNTVLENQKGTLIFWQHGCQSAKHLNLESPKVGEAVAFQKFAILDYLLGNLDRHLENWLTRVEGGQLKQIVAIDNSNAFPFTHPTDSPRDHFARRRQYQWREHRLANYSFSPAAREKMRGFTPQKVDEFWEFLEKEYGRNHPFLSPQRKRLLQQRAAVLYKMSGNIRATPALLASKNTDTAIAAFLS